MDGAMEDVRRAAQARWRRNCAGTVLALTVATLLCAGGGDWSYRGLCSWAAARANTTINVPLTHWQLELRLVRKPRLPATTLAALVAAHPLRSQLYAVAMLCSPRWALLAAWLLDREPGLALLHGHINHHQAERIEQLQRLLGAALDDLLPARGDRSSARQQRPAAAAALARPDSARLFWWGWLLAPALQAAWYMGFVVSPFKLAYASLIGLARTLVEAAVLLKCGQLLLARNRLGVVHVIISAYLLPVIMLLQSLAALLLVGALLPGWLAHIACVAFSIWGPLVSLALATTAWTPNRRELLAEAPAGLGGGGGLGAVGGGAGGAVNAIAAMAAGGGARGGAAGGHQPAVHWPPPLQIPAAVEEAVEAGLLVAPSFTTCPITHSIMAQPACTATGASYERASIMAWLVAQRRDPLTSRPLAPEQVSPNLALRSAIEAWLADSSAQLAAATRSAAAPAPPADAAAQQSGDQQASCGVQRRHKQQAGGGGQGAPDMASREDV